MILIRNFRFGILFYIWVINFRPTEKETARKELPGLAGAGASVGVEGLAGCPAQTKV